MTDRSGVRYQEEKRIKVLALDGPMTQYEYGTVTRSNRPGCQAGLALAPHTHVLAIDVDDLDVFKTSPVWPVLEAMGAQPISTRLDGDRRHYLVDMRHVNGWVKQGPIVGGDVKSNGFIPVPGSEHPSGDRYEPYGSEMHVIECTDELLTVLNGARQRAAGNGGGSEGGDLGNGQEPQLLSYTGKLVRGGFPVEEAWRLWLDKAQSFAAADASWPWTEEDRDVFDRHWAYCTAQQTVTSESPEQLPTWATQSQPAQSETSASDREALLPDARHLVRQANEQLHAQLGAGWYVTIITEKIRGKFSSEMHSHPLSVSWRTAPEGAQKLYKVIMERLGTGEELSEKWLNEYEHFDLDPGSGELVIFDKQAICAWLSSPEHPLLAVHKGMVVAVSDWLFDDSQLSAAAQLDRRYPGWTLNMPDPKAGASWTKETHVAAAKIAFELVMEAGGGNVHDVDGLTKLDRISHADLARALNKPENRVRFPELANRRAAGRSQAAAILKRLQDPEDHLMGQLREDGTWVKRPCETCQEHHEEIMARQIHVALESETWRDGHRWMGAPKGYGIGLNAFQRSQREGRGTVPARVRISENRPASHRPRGFINEGLSDRRREDLEAQQTYAAWTGNGNIDHLL